jgi:23S rRNA pseudouridine2605 synthase
MAKRSSGGRSGSRTNPNPRSDKKTFTRKSDSRPFKSSDKPSSGKPSRKSEDGGTSDFKPRSNFKGKPFGRRDEKRTGDSSERSDRPSYGKRNFSSAPGSRSKKFDSNSSSDKPGFKKAGNFSSGYKKRTSSEDSSSDRPKKFFKKSSEETRKPFEKKPYREESSARRSATGLRRERPYNAEEKTDTPPRKYDSSDVRKTPYKKRSSDNSSSDKPGFKKADNFSSGYKKRASSEDSSSDRPKKSFRKSSEETRKPFEKKTYREEPSTQRPSTGLRRERPYKNPEEKADIPSKKYASSEVRKTPYKKRSSEAISDTKGHGIREDIEPPVSTGKIRLNKFIANSGVCSRREADELITMGLISVNGKTITELGYKVNPNDEVRHESRVLRAERPVYILMNKPKGFLTTTSDPQERNTVMHLIGNAVRERVYPVGRLDRNTTGLLLLTNDGDLADKLMHPSHNAKKIYKVELDRPLTKGDAQAIIDGVSLEEGKAVVDDLAILTDDKKTVGIEIHIGWNRVIRRIFESLNYEVVKLDRSVYAGLDKKNLGRGEWRFLTKEELVRLKHYK